jgi:hypothetical protein
MTDGINLTGFNEVKPAVQHTIGEQYASDPASAFPAQDMSQQGPAGTTAKMVNSMDSVRSFGAGN